MTSDLGQVGQFGYSSSHYTDVIMTKMAYQIISLTVVYSTVYSDADQRKHQSSASLAFVRGIHHGPVNSPHKCPVTRKMFPFDDVITGLNAANLAWHSETQHFALHGIPKLTMRNSCFVVVEIHFVKVILLCLYKTFSLQKSRFSPCFARYHFYRKYDFFIGGKTLLRFCLNP